MNLMGLTCSPLDELSGSSNQEAQKGDTDFVLSTNVKPSNDPNHIFHGNVKTKPFPLNDSMDSFKDVATHSDELKKSSRFVFNSLVKLESAHNTRTSTKIRQHARIFWPQNHFKTSKRIQNSTLSRDQIPNKRVKLSYGRNNFSDDDDYTNLFDHDSKGIKPFNDFLHSREVVLRIGNKFATTEDIQCLCPGREIEDKIINIMALKTTLMQLHQLTDQTVWSLPSSFADDVLQGQSVNRLTTTYAIHLMPPFSSLKCVK
ncbi:hypothetical protein DEO72_LG4g868 [Vigna unguiculata]|uniref:Uncharacterized protein n=1 Tax=Vigna unguiculata TaxID=3917 RepID=A0A4D6LNZ7_VIGUN|nr:hypothetical protein DEO72_LG4g868 [Vigna unguiculata]